MNQLEAFLFFDKLWIFPTRGGREILTKNLRQYVPIFNQKNENKDESEL